MKAVFAFISGAISLFSGVLTIWQWIASLLVKPRPVKPNRKHTGYTHRRDVRVPLTLTVVTVFFAVLTVWMLKDDILSINGKLVTISTKDSFVFDYSTNGGRYTIGEPPFEFVTEWSKASDTSIYAYGDGPGMNGIVLLEAPIDIEHFGQRKYATDVASDESFRDSEKPRVGDAILWINTDGNYAITKVINIKDDRRQDSQDQLQCDFVILKKWSLLSTVKSVFSAN